MEEAKKQKKIINHKILNKHTIIGALLVTLISYLLLEGLFVGIPSEIFKAALPGSENIVQGITSIAGTVLIMLLFDRWFYPEYAGGFKGEKMLKWFLIALGCAVVNCALQLPTIYMAGRSLTFPTINTVALSCMGGFCEEAIFRANTCAYLMRQWKTDSGIIRTMLMTSAIFALTHTLNMAFGAPLLSTVCQVIFCFGLGMALSAIFLRCGSIWPCILTHFLADFGGLLDSAAVTKDGVMAVEASLTDVIDALIITAAFTAFAFILVRPSVRSDIRRIWDGKWSKSAEFQQ